LNLQRKFEQPPAQVLSSLNMLGGCLENSAESFEIAARFDKDCFER